MSFTSHSISSCIACEGLSQLITPVNVHWEIRGKKAIVIQKRNILTISRINIREFLHVSNVFPIPELYTHRICLYADDIFYNNTQPPPTTTHIELILTFLFLPPHLHKGITNLLTKLRQHGINLLLISVR